MDTDPAWQSMHPPTSAPCPATQFEGVGVGVKDGVRVPEVLNEGLGVPLGVLDEVEVRDELEVGVAVSVGVVLNEGVIEGVGEKLGVWLGEDPVETDEV